MIAALTLSGLAWLGTVEVIVIGLLLIVAGCWGIFFSVRKLVRR